MEKNTINIKLSHPNHLEYEFKKALLDLNSDNYFADVQNMIDQLSSKGWTQKYFYLVCMYMNHFLDLQEPEHDVIGGFIDCLTGSCISPYQFLVDADQEKKIDEFIYSSQVNPFSREDIKAWILADINS